MGDEPEITQVEKVPSETLPLDKTLKMSRQRIEMARKVKGKTVLKRKVKGLGRENTVHPQMNLIVIVANIHQRIQILTMVHHQNVSG